MCLVCSHSFSSVMAVTRRVPGAVGRSSHGLGPRLASTGTDEHSRSEGRLDMRLAER